jgi:DNA-binding MarR family transcriptional regulator
MTPVDSAIAVSRPAELTLRLIPRLTRWAQTRVVDEDLGAELSLRQLSALQMIEDETTTLGDVARRLMVTPAVVTGLIDRLEKRGYVRRVGSSGDRRRVNLALTDEGREAARRAEQRLIDEFGAKMANFSGDELKALERGLSLLDRVVQELEGERTNNRR